MTAQSHESPSRGKLTLRLGAAGAAEDRLLVALEQKYHIIAQLGEGGTARVWLAMARGPSGFNKLVVLKTIRGELFDDPSVVDMFLEEARLAARLNHPHIVQTNEVFEEANHPVIVMEYLDGVPFSVVLERQREGNALALAMLLRIISDALAGLHAAHEVTDYDGTALAVVHRDISPHNLFVTFTGQTKVLDFGIAQLSSRAELTETGVIKGKLRYVSPEQVSGGSAVDRRADVYSMGVVLWEVAAAQRMWAGIPEAQIMKRIRVGDLPRVQDAAPNVDDQLADVIEKALSTRPEHRYGSAMEFQADLDRYLSTLGSALRNRDVGRALSKMFDDVRQERKETIEAQLARTGKLMGAQLKSQSVPELTSFSNINAPHSLRPFSLQPGPKTLIAFAVTAMLAFLLVLMWPAPTHTTPTVAESPTFSSPPAPAPKQSWVEVRLTAFPHSARLILDGQPLSSNPYVGRFKRDPSEEHDLLVEAPGHRSETRRLQFTHNLEMVLTLHRQRPSPPADSSDVRPPSPKPAPSVRPLPRPKPRTAAPKTQPAAPPKLPDCSPPYYFDERGVKKYRPECL